ncbi:galactoside alpha-(1,2)-fucosyltransferase 2-like [Littorina saxatilis]|uniref:L-Fucosyltransferase n=1 Tax=Littorina saxatilis TaxID=31220 RepID=A0AAN9B439_9CAEN
MKTFRLKLPRSYRRLFVALVVAGGCLVLLLMVKVVSYPHDRHLFADHARNSALALDFNQSAGVVPGLLVAGLLQTDDLSLTGHAYLNLSGHGNESQAVVSSASSGHRLSATASPLALYTPPVKLKDIPPNGSGWWVEVAVTGQLGNRMFQYASLLGIAHMNGRTPYYKRSSRLDDLFHVTRLTSESHKGYIVVSERDFASYDPKFQTLPEANVLCMQYLQSWKYFHFIQDEIRREFTFKRETQLAASQLLEKQAHFIGNKTKVGVHVRRGDMLSPYHVKKGYHTAPASYVKKAMDYMRQTYGDVIFLIVTQNAGWCRSELKQGDYVIVDNAQATVHLALLASCDHVIMTVGTYGWWGGYLSGGDVVYWWDPKESVQDPPKSVEITKPEDFYPPSWVRLTG